VSGTTVHRAIKEIKGYLPYIKAEFHGAARPKKTEFL
jgi:hypothetical protein